MKQKNIIQPLRTGALSLALIGVFLFLGATAPVIAAAPVYPTTLPFVVRDTILAQDGDIWTVGGSSVNVSDETRLLPTRGAATVGAYVEVTGEVGAEGRALASTVTVLWPAGAPGQIIELSGTVNSIKSSTDGKVWYWQVDKQLVISTQPETSIIGGPGVGWLVWVVGVRAYDHIAALAIDGIAPNPSTLPVEFEGTIERIDKNFWQVDSKRIVMTANTLILGVPVLGATAEVRARVEADNSLTGLVVRAVDPSTDAYVNALVNEIVTNADGSQTWNVTLFKGVGDDLQVVPGVVHVGDGAYVEERRAALRTGVYAEIDGRHVGTNKIEADLARLDRPTPVTITGLIGQTSPMRDGQVWRMGAERIWTNTPQIRSALQSVARTAADQVSVRGLRLGNGMIWVQQLAEAPQSDR